MSGAADINIQKTLSAVSMIFSSLTLAYTQHHNRLQTLSFSRFAEEVRRIYYVEREVLPYPLVHLQQKTPGHIFSQAL